MARTTRSQVADFQPNGVQSANQKREAGFHSECKGGGLQWEGGSNEALPSSEAV